MISVMDYYVGLIQDYREEIWVPVLGLTLWLISFVFPFRYIAARNPIRWDLIGALTGISFAYLADYLLDIPTAMFLTMSLFDSWHGFVWQLPPIMVAGLFLVLSDFLVYWAHRSMHSRMLWQVHAWHHSAEHVYFIAGLRGSLQDTLILFTPYAVAYVVFPLDGTGMLLITLLIVASINPFIHSNLRIPFPSSIEKVFVTPRFHFVHHSANRTFGNSNYGQLFTVWDRLFGTFTDPDRVPSDQSLGLGYPAKYWKLLLGMKTGQPNLADDEISMRAPG